MCACDESPGAWPSCTRHRHLDYEHADFGVWSDRETRESAHEQYLSTRDFDSPWKDA